MRLKLLHLEWDRFTLVTNLLINSHIEKKRIHFLFNVNWQFFVNVIQSNTNELLSITNLSDVKDGNNIISGDCDIIVRHFLIEYIYLNLGKFVDLSCSVRIAL